MKAQQNDYINLFAALGTRLGEGIPQNVIEQACNENAWFTPQGIQLAVNAIRTRMLDREKLNGWLTQYLSGRKDISPKKVGVIMAGNIPLVGFFDMMCVVCSSNECYIKTSSKDSVLMNHIVGLLKTISPEIPVFKLTTETELDAIIATGSDNSAIYFRSQYKDIPLLLRKNMHSIALLKGDESDEQLALLAEDIFTHNSLGCRNVSTLLLPTGFSVDRMVGLFQHAESCLAKGFENNYRQNRALCLLNGIQFIDGGFFLLRESASFQPDSLTTVNYMYYDNLGEAENWIESHMSEIQCLVSNINGIPNIRSTDFGKAQYPELNDYPDRVDVMSFLSESK